MLFRYFSIFSSCEKFHEEIVKLKEIFKRNSHTEKFINRRIKTFLKKFHEPKVRELVANRKELILVLTYLGHSKQNSVLP